MALDPNKFTRKTQEALGDFRLPPGISPTMGEFEKFLGI